MPIEDLVFCDVSVFLQELKKVIVVCYVEILQYRVQRDRHDNVQSWMLILCFDFVPQVYVLSWNVLHFQDPRDVVVLRTCLEVLLILCKVCYMLYRHDLFDIEIFVSVSLQR